MDLAGLVEKRTQKGTVYYENETGEIVAKGCSKCAEVKDLYQFSRSAKLLGGRYSSCKMCETKRMAKYYEENKGKCLGRSANYYEENKDWHASYMKQYREEHKGKIVKSQAKYYRENKGKYAERAIKYYEKNKGEIAKYQAEWRRENKQRMVLIQHRRRARKAALPDTLTNEQYAKTLAYFGNACALTGEKLNLTREHAIPIAIGHGGTTRENMYPMVFRLNSSKKDRNIFEWFKANRQRFELSQARFDKLIAWLASANAMTVEEYRKYVYWCHANPGETGAV